MKLWSLAGSTAALALFAGAAQADVTPEEVWQNWQDMSAGFGQTVATGSAGMDGDAYVVTDLTLTTEEEGVTTTSTIPEVRFTDKGDGTVDVTMSDSYPVTITEGDSVAEITVTAPGLLVNASGTVEAMSYAYEAPSLEIALSKVDGKTAAEAGADVKGVLVNLVGSYLVEPVEGGTSLDATFAADSLDITIVGKDPETGDDVDGMFSVAEISGEALGNLVGLENDNAAEALKLGFALSSAVDWGAVAYNLNVKEATGETLIAGGSEGGAFEFALDAAKLLLAGGGQNVTISASGPEIPLPVVALSYAESAFRFEMPVSASDVPGDFTVLVKLVDAAISDEIWAMFDPQATLPRDPATLVIDTKGKARLTTDLTDEAAMAALGDVPPGEVHALDVTELHAKIAGAELTGGGAFTFDNSDMMTFGGVPAPTGKLDLKLFGGNTLLDKLVALGLLTEEDAMGARMAFSMFANQGAAPDELTSTVEFKDKHLYVNGQMLQ